jgi:hypothetical protein
VADSKKFIPVRGGVPGLDFRPDTSGWLHFIQSTRGFVPGMQKALYEAHLDMAHTVQRYTVEELQRQKSPRPQRPTSLTTRSLLDKRNREVTAQGFLVGTDWLVTSSPAKRYIRRLEGGGPNPMARFGLIQGWFWYPSGRYPGAGPQGGSQEHGRLRWRPGQLATTSATGRRGSFVRASSNTFRVDPNDVVAMVGGYRLIEGAGARFGRRMDMPAIYQKHIDRQGLRFVQLSIA